MARLRPQPLNFPETLCLEQNRFARVDCNVRIDPACAGIGEADYRALIAVAIG
jgi:hypothetical protein